MTDPIEEDVRRVQFENGIVMLIPVSVWNRLRKMTFTLPGEELYLELKPQP